MNTMNTNDIYTKAAADIKDYVTEKIAAHGNMMSAEYYDVHLRHVLAYGKKLSPLFGARQELVEIAALSHDLGAIMDYSTLAQHHNTGAEITGKLLEGKIPGADISVISDAIRNHNQPVLTGSPEAMTLSHADALSKFDSPVYWISYAWKRRFDSFGESVTWYEGLLEKTYDMMLPEARAFIEEKYAGIKTMLASMKG